MNIFVHWVRLIGNATKRRRQEQGHGTEIGMCFLGLRNILKSNGEMHKSKPSECLHLTC